MELQKAKTARTPLDDEKIISLYFERKTDFCAHHTLRFNNNRIALRFI